MLCVLVGCRTRSRCACRRRRGATSRVWVPRLRPPSRYPHTSYEKNKVDLKSIRPISTQNSEVGVKQKIAMRSRRAPSYTPTDQNGGLHRATLYTTHLLRSSSGPSRRT